MREILFRGKRIDNGEWVYGYLFIDIDNLSLIRKNTESWARYNDYQVYTYTVGQFTGLKDKNGNKIFEGDIVEYVGLSFQVEILDGTTIAWRNKSASNLISYQIKESIIIGNIHDNKELLD